MSARKPFFRSRPGTLLLVSGIAVVAAGLLLPLTPLGPLFNFGQLPAAFYAVLAAMVIVYLMMVELLKRWFYRRHPL